MNRIKDKNHMIISIGTGKSLDTIQHPFITKDLKKINIKESCLNIIKTTCDKPIANITSNGGKN